MEDERLEVLCDQLLRGTPKQLPPSRWDDGLRYIFHNARENPLLDMSEVQLSCTAQGESAPTLIPCHAAVLLHSAAPFFAPLESLEAKIAQQQGKHVIEVPGFSPDVVLRVLKYLYRFGAQQCLEEPVKLEVLKLAKFWELDDLVKIMQ